MDPTESIRTGGGEVASHGEGEIFDPKDHRPTGRSLRWSIALGLLVLAVLLLYSYTKRITRWSHLVLGLALGIAPAAAWIAVRGTLDPRIIVLTAAVLFWVGGFDVLYACQDMAHDREAGLNSIPTSWGIHTAFWFARGMHLIMLGLLCLLLKLFALHAIAWAGVAAVALLLLYEHLIVSPTDLRRLNAAFFTLNGIISMVFFFFIAASLLLSK